MTVDTQKLRELLANRQSGWPFPSDQALVEQFPALLDEIDRLKSVAHGFVDEIARKDAENDALRAELQARQWQPIETAPKDSTVWAYNGEQGRMRWIEGEGYALWAWEDELLSDVDPMPIQPTSWMPLPPAPPQGDGA